MPHFDIIHRLDRLSAHPESDFLDTRLLIWPWTSEPEPITRRVWLRTPGGDPVLSFYDATIRPQTVHHGPPRWIDYGTVEICSGSSVLTRVRGLEPADAERAHLVISEDPGLDLSGATLAEAERKILGLARCDAGTTSIRPNRVPVGEPASFAVRYQAGPRGLGAGHLVRFTVPRCFSRPQTDDPGEPGYTTVLSTDCRLSLDSIDICYLSHEKIDVIYRLESDLEPFAGFEIEYETDTTYIFDRTWQGTELPIWFSLVPVLTASVSTGPRDRWTFLARGNGHTVDFVPGPAERLHLFLPGRRRIGENLSLRGTITDRYRNTPRTRQPMDLSFDLVLERGDETIPLSGPAGYMQRPHRFEVQLPPLEPGIYRAVARQPDARILARSNPLEVMEVSDERSPIYWGEIHTHTECSDGCGTVEELHRHARDEGALDFVSAADHLGRLSENDWLQMQDIANAFDDPGRFCTLIGYEIVGHCAYSARRRLEPMEFGDFAEAMRPDPDITIGPHGHRGLISRQEGFPEEDVPRDFIQVYGTFGACDFRDSPLVQPEERDEGYTLHEVLGTGEKLGFTGGGDIHGGRAGFSAEAPERQGKITHDIYFNHPFRDGLTAALMERLDRPELIAALKNRRTYATTGARILLEFSAAGLPMGRVGKASEVTCHATVHAVSELEALQIIRDGEIVCEQPTSGRDAELEWTDPAGPDGESYYYLRVLQADGQMGWSSPVWIRKI
jgi:hypothetical protein